MWSSSRMGYFNSWYGRVVVVRSWTFDEGSWRRSSRGDTARCLMREKLRSVGSLDTAGRSLQVAEISRVIECSWTIVAES